MTYTVLTYIIDYIMQFEKSQYLAFIFAWSRLLFVFL